MLTINYADVVAGVVKRTGIDDPGADTFISTTQMELLVKDAAQSLSAIVRECDPSWLQSTQALNTVANQGYVDLAGFTTLADISLLGWVLDDAVIPLRYASPEDWFMLAVKPGGWDRSIPPYYRLHIDRIMLYPTPTRVEPLRMMYSNHLVLTQSASSFIGTDNMQEYLILHVASRVMQAQEKDDALFLRSLADYEQRLRTTGVRRDKNAIRTMRDVDAARETMDVRKPGWLW